MLNLSRSKPGVLKTFLLDIIANNKISYLKDTTIILTVYEMKVDDVIVLYKILKDLKRLKAVEKVINKKEFLIIGVYSLKIMEYFNNPNKWYILALKQALDELFNKSNSLVYYINPPDENCDMAIKRQNQWYYIHTSVLTLNNLSDKVIHAYICNGLRMRKNMLENESIAVIKYYHNQTLFKREIEKMWKKPEKSQN